MAAEPQRDLVKEYKYTENISKCERKSKQRSNRRKKIYKENMYQDDNKIKIG